jgi:hypothetical protein
MTCVGISNAIILIVTIILIHGLLLKSETRALAKTTVDRFTDSFVKHELAPIDTPPESGPAKCGGIDEMFEFANSNESWSACDTNLYSTAVADSVKFRTQCVDQEARQTNAALINTYADESIANGAEIEQGLRGFENDWGGLHPC